MAGGRSLRASTPYRAFHIGYPGSGKTGALASLANAGYKIRILSFEGNYEPLLNYVDDRALDNIDIAVLQDKIDDGDHYLSVAGIPQAFNKALKLMNEWKYTDEDGVEINLGKPPEWGPDTVLVDDSLTSMAAAIKRRAIKMSKVSPISMTSAVWGLAVADLEQFIEKQKAMKNGYHLIVNCHKQMLGPSDFLSQDDKKRGNEDVLEKKIEVIRDGLIPTRIYPVSATKPNAQNIHGALPIMLEFVKVEQMGRTRYVIETRGGPEIDVKIPSAKVKATYPIETGLAEIFEALGYQAPGF